MSDHAHSSEFAQEHVHIEKPPEASAMLDAEPIIKCHKVNKWFGEFHVLRDVSVEVAPREVVVIIGPSGSGKSTFIRCINRLEEHQEGEIVVDGIPLGNDIRNIAAIRREIGMVFQQFNLFPHMSVLENVMCGPVHAKRMDRGVAETLARRLLDRVGMSPKLHARPATLSGGQQQRVAIARALANEPVVMLFDEPTSSLDPRMTAEVLAVMADLAKDGQTMLVVSHAMGFVRRSATAVHVFAEGRVVESGPPQQIFEGAAHPATKELLHQADL